MGPLSAGIPREEREEELEQEETAELDVAAESVLVVSIDEKKAGQRSDVALAELLALTRSHVQKLLDEGRVKRDDGKVLRANYRLRLGDKVSVKLPAPQPLKAEPENIPLNIVYEDDDVIVVNKDRGMVTHPAAGNFTGTLVNALLYHCTNLSGINGVIRPVGSFIFVGPTGVGKTDLCKALAESLFGDERLMVRFDMSEYMEKGATTKLIGAPPGYVGYDDTQSCLTERIRRKPYSVVLFDEIEKAHPDVFNILLQILDDGRLTDSRGRTVDFKNTVIILTSNVGAHAAKEPTLGFGAPDEESAYARMRESIESALKAQFRPEFLNRIDEIVVFHKLTKEDAAKICTKILSGIVGRLKESKITLKVTDRAKMRLVDEGYSEEFGARPLKRIVQRRVEDRLSEEILQGRIPPKSVVVFDADPEGYFLRYE